MVEQSSKLMDEEEESIEFLSSSSSDLRPEEIDYFPHDIICLHNDQS